MPKRKIAEEPRKAILVMPNDEFKMALEHGIEEGGKLFEIKVASTSHSYVTCLISHPN